MNKLDVLAQNATMSTMLFRDKDALTYCKEIFREIREHPSLLKTVQNPYGVGVGLTCLLDVNVYNDIDIKQSIASIAYLLLSDAIKKNSNNAFAYEARLIVLIRHDEPFNYTLINALDIKGSPIEYNYGYQIIDANHKMRWSDFQKCITKIEEESFRKQYILLKNEYETNVNAITEGFSNHEKLYVYLKEKIYDNEDVDFS